MRIYPLKWSYYMKRALKRTVPFLLALGILASVAWYLLVYDREFTRDMLISNARFYDARGNTKFAAMLYDLAYDYTGKDEDVAIELAQQYKADGNYTKAEYTLTNAIADGGTADLYIALCKTFVEQDKLLDAVNMLDHIANPEIKAQLDALRPQAPTPDFEPGYYSKYISVTLSCEEGTLLYTIDGEYPSTAEDAHTEPIVLPAGETKIYALNVAGNGLVSPLTILGYTVGGVIEEAKFADPEMESAIRAAIGADSDDMIMTDQLWQIRDFTIPQNAQVLTDLALLPYLEVIHADSYRFESLSFLSSLRELKQIHLTGCRFPTADLELLATLPVLERLTLSNCSLSTIAGLENAQRLTYLDLSSNTLRNLEALSSLPYLSELYLQHNAVTGLDMLSTLTSLQKLDVSYNSVTSVQPLAQCSKLTWLNVGNNLIQNLSGVEQISGLSSLFADQNQLSDVSLLSQCLNLTEVNLSGNALTSIQSLSGLSGLINLNCSYNALTELPSWPDGSALSVIDCSYNQIGSVKPLGNLEELTYVYMDYNQLTTLDPIAECFRLVMVNAYGNEIDDVTKLTDHNIIVNYDPT